MVSFIKNLYQKFVLPRLITRVMDSEKFQNIRRDILSEASGVVLEIGVGSGYNFIFYKNISKLIAIEPSKELVEIARTNAARASFPIEFLISGAEKIPLPDHSVDTAVSTWTLYSVADPVKVLEELRRVLKPTGKFIFVDHGASSYVGVRLIQSAVTPISKYFTGNCHYDRDIEQLILDAGFAFEKIEYSSERFLPLMYTYRGSAKLMR